MFRTQVQRYDPQAFEDLRVQALCLNQEIDSGWECHGLGMAKKYLTPEIRLHVWDRRFRHVGRWTESIHAHRWDLWSVVLHGHLIQQEVVAVDAPFDGAYVEWEVGNRMSPDPTGLFLKSGRKLGLHILDFKVGAGYAYTMPQGSFHRTDAVDGTVALMRREKVQGLSSCLIPLGVQPRHGRDWDTLPDMSDILNQHLRAAGFL